MRAHMWRRPQKWVRDGKWGRKLGLLCQVGEIKRLSLWLSQILRVLNSNYKIRRQNSLRKYEQARHMHVDPWSPLLILFIQSSYNFAPSVSFFYYKDLIIAAVASTDDDTLFKIRSERQRLFSYRQTIALYFFFTCLLLPFSHRIFIPVHMSPSHWYRFPPVSLSIPPL